ncbi:hypothetical protein ACQR3W_22015 [Rhodococcus ruber]|uniref:Uncharacterized protein n=1 Tax=Rhodococcus ruber TaxID=1830 RepID=A0A098BLH1_9NOCA|nr:hypothetical protein [Rhodococcus ruber]MCZ4505925.1 hypothetical protein [Rhodococcus ruber]MCZ4533468.1 hypothetical protein [Rhodococcus ruber]CDZ89047.1 hypothetical protein RHRU231_450214 [Rhodococcus ruber]
MNMTHSAHDTVAHDLTARQEGFETQWQIACGVHSSASQDICDTHGHLACGTNLPAAIKDASTIRFLRRVSTSEDGHRARGTQATPAVFGPNLPTAKEAAMPNYVLLWGLNFRRTISYAVPKKLPFGGFNLPHQPPALRYPNTARWRGTQLSVSPSA